ncbi:hypothetical protein EV360DRAFT_82560 [Lentinula raphanica]|nr:hypothetical protein EV360DRAFT_82560 [Lentinula raphanica]
MVVPTLPFDILLLILDHLLPDSSSCTNDETPDCQSKAMNALYYCSLASRELSQVAGRVLYRSVELNPSRENNAHKADWDTRSRELAFRGHQTRVDEYGLPMAPHPLLSALDIKSLNPTYTYVQNLAITGYLSTLPPGSSNQLPALLADAIRLFTSKPHAQLRSLRFTPETCHPDTFVQSLEVLSEKTEVSRCLQELHLNQHAFDDENKTDLLARVKGLKKLTLENPTRVLLQALVKRDSGEGWLHVLQTGLVELHLTNDCGSITPGVLNSFMPYLSQLRCFTLGISYSLADKDIFAALSGLNELRSLSIRWYLQLNSPPPSVFLEDWPLTALQVLKVGYSSWSLRSALPRNVAADSDHPLHTHHHAHLRETAAEKDEVAATDASDIDDLCPLCSWVMKVTAGSPALREVIFIDEDQSEKDDGYLSDELADEDEDPVNAVADRVAWMMRGGGMNFPESIIEEEEEDHEVSPEAAEP